MTSKSNRFIPALMLATAGVGVGNLTASREPVEVSVPVPTEAKVEYREELHHGADKSLKEAFNLPSATNAQIVAYVEKKDGEIKRLKKLNAKAASALSNVSRGKPAVSKVKQYYGG